MLLLLTGLFPLWLTAQTLEWLKFIPPVGISPSNNNGSTGIALDGRGNVLVSGSASCNLSECDYTERGTGWVAKFSRFGVQRWQKYVISSTFDSVNGTDSVADDVAVDESGNVFLAGSTLGQVASKRRLSSKTSAFVAGQTDAWVAKFSEFGQPLWQRQMSISTAENENSVHVICDNLGNLYISGATKGALGGINQGDADIWIAKLSSSGQDLWKLQFGTIGADIPNDIGVDLDGNIVVTGITTGAIYGINKGAEDAWLAKFDANGKKIWKRQLGTPQPDLANALAIDSAGNILIAGETTGSIRGTNQGETDAWLAKFSPQGKRLWLRQLGTSAQDGIKAAATDSSGNFFVSGYTYGSLAGTNLGGVDAWFTKYDANGTQMWSYQVVTASANASFGNGIAVDDQENVFLAVKENKPRPFNSADAWVAKYTHP